jgi:hypothetical protein
MASSSYDMKTLSIPSSAPQAALSAMPQAALSAMPQAALSAMPQAALSAMPIDTLVHIMSFFGDRKTTIRTMSHVSRTMNRAIHDTGLISFWCDKSMCPMRDDSIAILMDNIPACCVHLNMNNFPSRNPDLLVDLISLNTSVRKIWFELDTIHGEGLELVLNCIGQNTSLRSLIFRNAYLSTNDIRIVSNFVRENTTLCEFGICNNPGISVEGIECIGESLRINRTLRSLCFSQNGLIQPSIDKLVNILVENTTIQSVDLSFLFEYYDVDYNLFYQMISSVIIQNTSITFLDLSKNGLVKYHKENIEDAVVRSGFHRTVRI